MSRVDQLIAELCPDGVEYRALGEVARIRNGKDYKAFGPGEVPVYGSGGVMTRVDTAAHGGPSVLIPRKGSLSNLYYVEGPFWTVDTIFYTQIDESIINPKFFFHCLLVQRLGELNQAGGVPSLTQTVLNRVRIPVPPLPVQQEIVRILDGFTQLEAELEAELEARRRQYEYYRDSLLTFEERERVRWVTMGEVGIFTRGRRFLKSDVVPAGIPSIHYGEIYTRYGLATRQAFSSLRPELGPSLRFAAPGDVVIAAVGETVEEVGKAVAWLGETPVAIHDDCFAYHHSLEPRFVAHYTQTPRYQAEKARHVARAKVKRISGAGLAAISIPVPPIDEQRRLADTLDTFDALVNDLTSGLPAEIAARRKQYEHYRDRLLAFTELEQGVAA